MQTVKRSVFVLVAGALAGLIGLSPVASAETAAVRIITPNADRSCAGDVDTVVWNRPTGVVGLTGYRVIRFVTTMNPPMTFADEVGPEQTSLSFPAVFGVTIISVYAIGSEGIEQSAFASGYVSTGQAPVPMQWSWDGASVGDGTATVPFRWYGPKDFFNTGNLSTSVQVSESSRGITMPLTNGAAAFRGLTTGVGYRFTAVTSNACGSTTSSRSPTYTPGVAPVWTKAAPPLRASPGQYVYNFAANGDPLPMYRLVGAPSWLTISSKGVVSGRPPAGTTSFSYSVVASNGVGIEVYLSTDIAAGPFEVAVSST